MSSKIKTASKVALRYKIAQSVLDRSFRDPENSTLYEQYKDYFKNKIKREEAQRQIDEEDLLNPIGRLETSLGEVQTLPLGNASISHGMSKGMHAQNLDENGNPRPLVYPLFDDQNENVWQEVYTPLELRRISHEGGTVTRAFVYIGFCNENLTYRVLHVGEKMQREGILPATDLKGFPLLDSTLEDVFAWLGEKESCTHQINWPMKSDLSGEPYKTELNANEKYLIRKRDSALLAHFFVP